MVDLLYKEEVYNIVGAEMEVYNELGCGFLEAVYHEALEIVFREKQIPFESKPQRLIQFRGRYLKKRYESDFLVYGKIVLEIKATSNLASDDEAQLLNYLNATKFRVGVLMNFGKPGGLQWKRMVL
jgi:GxxExxY protein